MKQRNLLIILLFVLAIIAAGRMGMMVYESRQNQKAAALAAEMRLKPQGHIVELLSGKDTPAPSSDGEFPCVSESLIGTDLAPNLSKCQMPVSHSVSVDRFEADLRYGNFVLRESDLSIHDVFDVPLTRTYNSGDFIHPNHLHAFGKNSNHPFDISPLGSRNPYTYQLIALEDGDFLFFNRVSSGTGFADAIYQHSETSTRFYKAVTAWNGNGWTTWLPDGSSIWFPEAYSSTNMAQGAPIEIRDSQSNVLRLIRDGQRNLTEIRTPNNHWIRFHYDGQNCIVRAEDDQGNWAAYSYDENEMLTDVSTSAGQKRHYSYDGVLMTLIEDGNGKALLRNTYRGGKLVRQAFDNDQIFSYAYSFSESGLYTESADVTLADGTRTKVYPSASVPSFLKSSPR
jgi:YD repeat-containing protein